MADASMIVVLHYSITIMMDFAIEQRELYRFILADGEKMEYEKEDKNNHAVVGNKDAMSPDKD
ncbi:MAG: hypothetical protein KJ606_09760 [Chloroflexi bacterium]|nr:hypothetical protein [Chloroflexota bacterium]